MLYQQYKIIIVNYIFNFCLSVSGYDCGMFVISIAEHLCKELCEGYTIPLTDLINSESVSKKRSQVKQLILQVAEEFGS